MKLRNPTAEIFVPDGQSLDLATKRITHLGIGAHQDDLEFMAFHGISECYESDRNWFGGVTCTNGSGSARTGTFAGHTDEQMRAVRREEQNEAARVGKYGLMVQLDYASRAIQSESAGDVVDDLRGILAAATPSVVYTHNPADKHSTHVAVVTAVLMALRQLPADQRPHAVYGCEGWRDLDWLPDEDKVALDVSRLPELAETLNRLFVSQIAGGKRYDLATLGRRRANATFFQSHHADASEQLVFAMNLMPLIADPARDLADYVCGFIAKFEKDVRDKLSRNRIS